MKIIQTFIGLIAVIILITGSGCDPTTDEQVTDTLECVVPGNICTRDINECGNPSSCTCPDGYHYSAALGDCIYEFGVADDTETSAASEAIAATQDHSTAHCALPPEGMCSRDINECGNPSSCDCPEGYQYSPATGQCLLDLR